MKKAVLLTVFFALVTCAFTYPVVLRMGEVIPAFYSTDESYGVVWSFWWRKYAWLLKVPSSQVHLLAWPDGIRTVNPEFFPLWGFFAKWIAILSNEIFAYNLIMLSTFVLAALAMFYLARMLTGNSAAAVFAALVFAFCPFHSVRAWQHFGTAQIQWIPVYLFFLFRLRGSLTLLNALGLGVSLALNYYYDVHYAYFLCFTTALFFVLSMSFPPQEARGKFTWFLFGGLACGVLLIVPALAPFFSVFSRTSRAAADANAYSLVRPFDDLFSQSARPLSYLLPFTEQPFLGGVTRMFIGTKFWGESLTEHNVFLGFVPLILAFTAFRKRKALVSYYEQKGKDARFMIRFFLLMLVLNWFLSQPPWWDFFGLKLYMPSFFMYKMLPMFRAYVRFGIMVMLATAVLAAFAFDFLLSRVGGFRRFALPAAIGAAALFEFWYVPAEHVADLSRYPAVYDWLRHQAPEAVIAEYPLDIEGPNELYKFYQTKHHKRMINGAVPRTAAHERIKGLRLISSAATADSLKQMGVRFVLVHLEEYKKAGLAAETEEALAARRNSGLRFLREDHGIEVYEVIGGAKARQ